MIKKYGKNIADIKAHKQKFFEDNDILLKANCDCAEIYKKQPLRKICKTCKTPFDDAVFYTSHGVEYAICSKCEHVNGLHEETEKYNEYLYAESDYGNYVYVADEQSKEKYDRRIKDIYTPKAMFLKEILETEGKRLEDVYVFDIGAGSGYFISACDDLNICSYGVDMSKDQVAFGNLYLHTKNGGKLDLINGVDLEKSIAETKANVITAIGVLEHVTDYHSVIEKIKENECIEYMFISVPTLGLSNFLEAVFPDVFNRHLGGVHTHVFSQKSIEYLCELYDMDIVAKWQFGTDMMDLYRSLIVKNGVEIAPIIESKLYKCLDEMQKVLDKNDFCSETHAIIKCRGKKRK